MKILALMMFLASSLAFSHPADLVDSASPACQETASTLVACQKEREIDVIAMKESLCPRFGSFGSLTTFVPGNRERLCKLIEMIPAPSCSAAMEDYLLCEISEIKAQTVDRLQRIRDVLTLKRFRQIVAQGGPAYLLYRYFKEKAEQREIEE